MAKPLTNRHATALDLIKTPNVTLLDLCGLLLTAIEEARREGADPHADPAVRLIAAKLSRLANVTAANRFALIQECERRLAEFVSRPRLLQIIEAPVTSSDERKRAFHREAAKLLREVAIHLGLRPGAYDIRSNRAGPAVSGEITLHGEAGAGQPVVIHRPGNPLPPLRRPKFIPNSRFNHTGLTANSRRPVN